MKKKVAIITIKEMNPNYGNALQNYATKSVLENLGFDVDTLFFECSASDFRILFFKRFIQKTFFYKLPGNRFWWQFYVLKLKKFYKFYKNYCPYKYITSFDGLNEKYDYFVVGSDQVWNPTWYDNNLLKKDMYLLTFARPEQKVCIAPSFGVSELPLEWEAFFAEQLDTFPRLSVRESSGAEIIKKLTGKNAETLIDPTLMLYRENWDQIVKKPKKINTGIKYALLYFLGEISDARKQYIESKLIENKLVPYSLNDRTVTNLYTVDPSEFLYLIAHAELIFTDSFHACAFSFIYDKPFLAFERKESENELFSRITHFLDLFQLQRKYVDSGLQNDLLECDFREGKRILETERKKTDDFLKRSLHLNDESLRRYCV